MILIVALTVVAVSGGSVWRWDANNQESHDSSLGPDLSGRFDQEFARIEAAVPSLARVPSSPGDMSPQCIGDFVAWLIRHYTVTGQTPSQAIAEVKHYARSHGYVLDTARNGLHNEEKGLILRVAPETRHPPATVYVELDSDSC